MFLCPDQMLKDWTVMFPEGQERVYVTSTGGLSCLQVFLGPNGEVEEYSVISVEKNAAISSDLTLDQNQEQLFIMTPNMVQ